MLTATCSPTTSNPHLLFNTITYSPGPYTVCLSTVWLFSKSETWTKLERKKILLKARYSWNTRSLTRLVQYLCPLIRVNYHLPAAGPSCSQQLPLLHVQASDSSFHAAFLIQNLSFWVKYITFFSCFTILFMNFHGYSEWIDVSSFNKIYLSDWCLGRLMWSSEHA